MPEATGSWSGRRVRRLVAVAAAVTVPIGTVVAALLFFEDRIPKWVYWKTGLFFLVALEASYAAALLASLAALPVLVVLLARARRAGVRRPALARGILLCGSVLLALVLAEAAAAVWRARNPGPLVGPAAGPEHEPQTERDRRPGRPVVAADPIALPTEFPAPPEGDDAVRLVVLGESSAQGVPYNFWVSVGSMVVWQLDQAIPGRRFALEVLADSGETLENQHRKLTRLSRRPDALIVYCGHNEFSARFPWSRSLRYYGDERPPSAWETLAAWVERVSPLCRLIRESADKCRVAIPPPPGGHRSLVDVPAYTSEEFAALLVDFERRLERIVAYAERVGAVPILIIPPANDAGFEPNRSYLPASTPYAEREAFAREFLAARRQESAEASESLARYRTLVERYPTFAEAHYRLGLLLERSGAWDEAYGHFVMARDLDGLPMRLPSRFQAVYRAVAARHSCILIDSQAYFHAIGRHGLLDEELFHDGMHPSLRGQIALAQAVLQGIRKRRAFGWPESTLAPIIDPARCAATFRLGPYEWGRLCSWGAMFYDLTSPLRWDPSLRRAKLEAFVKAQEKIAAGQAPEAVGLPNIGVPRPVPAVAGAAVLTRPRPAE